LDNPKLILTRFRRSRGTNYLHIAVTASLVDEEACSIADYMVDAIQHIRQRADAATYWSFADFEIKELKVDAIARNTAVVLEYPLSYRADLETALDEIGYAHWLVGTEQDATLSKSTPTNHIAVIFPLNQPIENPLKAGKPTDGRYNRVAAMLRDELHQHGVSRGGMSEGSTSRTFLIQPHATSVVEGFPGEVLDPSQYIEKTKDWDCGRQPAPTSAPCPTSDGSDGLFVWGC
jgi:hypothetical protein